MPIFSEDEIVSDAFTYFRESGFPYRSLPLHMCKQEINKLSELPDEKLDTSNLAYQVADTYHPERFSIPVNGMKSPIQGFHDDKVLERCLRRMLTHGTGIKTTLIGGVGGIAITSGVQGASNFRPAFALKMYRRFCTAGSVILDTSTGFGGRLIGFMAFVSGARYIGIDPNLTVCSNNLKMASDLGFGDRVTIVPHPVEDVSLNLLKGSVDFSFTSPPYFSKELYTDQGNTQSWSRYKEADEWKSGFLRKMFDFQFSSLKPGAFSAVNIADVKIRNKSYPLVQWSIEEAVAAGFSHHSTESMALQKRMGSGHDGSGIAKEALLIFQKPF